MLRVKSCLALILLVFAGCATAPPPLLHDKNRVTQTNQVDEVKGAERVSTPPNTFAQTHSSGDVFAGNDRRDAKTSVATGGVKSFSSIAALRASFPTDEFMQGLRITRAPDSERTTQEQYNVEGYIFAASKESDNDFHLIVGDKDCGSGDCIINVEVSGLPQDPADSSFPMLSAVRTKFLAYFNQGLPSRGYKRFEPPIGAVLTGSVFFDVDHRAGAVGPSGLKPSSAWEIHPLTDISFGP